MIVAVIAGLVAAAVSLAAADRLPRLAGYNVETQGTTWPQDAWLLAVAVLGALLVWAQVDATAYLWTLLAAAYFLLIAVVDWRHGLILNITTYPAMLTVIAYHALSGSDWRVVLLGGTLAFGIFYGTRRINPASLGGGDVKLATLIGLLLGFPGVLWALLVGGAGAAAYALWQMVLRDAAATQGMAYGPFLCFGAVVALMVNPFVMIV